MKKLVKLSLLIPGVFIVGLSLIIIGSKIENQTMTAIGRIILSVGLPVTMFVSVIIGIIWMITGKLNDDSSEDTSSPTKEQEQTELTEINTSYGRQSQRNNNRYLVRQISYIYQNATKKEKVLGWLFFGFLMTDFAFIFVFLLLEFLPGIITCFSIFGGTILIAFFIKLILEKTSIGRKVNPAKNQKILQGKVKNCFFSRNTSTGDFTVRVVKVVYRVVISAQGQEYTAYTEQFYEIGDIVSILVIGKSRASIIEKDSEETEEE